MGDKRRHKVQKMREFRENLSDISHLAIAFVGDSSACGEIGCPCGMEYPWAVVVVTHSEKRGFIFRSDWVKACIGFAGEFREHHQFSWEIKLTPMARTVLEMEQGFQRGMLKGEFHG